MGRQSGNIFITGTIGNLCFYRMDGQYYVRLKSSLTGKRVKKDPAFKGTMYYAGLFGNASGIDSEVYRALPPSSKIKGLYRKLTGMAMQLLKEGIDKERIVLLLQESLIPQTPITQSVETDMLPSLTSSRFVHAVINSVFKSDEGRHVTAPLDDSHSPP